MNVSDVMTKRVITVDKGTTVTKALSLMDQYGFKELPVVYNGDLIGLITFSSIVTYPRYSTDLKVDKLLFKPPIVSESDDLFTALKLIAEAGVHGLPVTRGDSLVGFISDFDIVKSLKSDFKDLKVVEVMRKAPPSLKKDDSVARARKLMYYKKVTSMPVIDGSKLIGVFKESDLFYLYKPHEGMGYGIQGKGDSKKALDVKIKDVLMKNYHSATVDEKASNVVNLMLKNDLDSIIIVDDSDKPVGYVDFFELIRHLYEVKGPPGVMLKFSGFKLDFPTNALLTKVVSDHLNRLSYLAKNVVGIGVRIKGLHSGGGTRKFELDLSIELHSGVIHRVKKVGYALRECLAEALNDAERLMKKDYKRGNP